jgi:hypothetical protein
MKIIFFILFTTIAAFPSVGTSTGVMRQKIMYKRIMPRNMQNKFSRKLRKHSSLKQFVSSMNAVKIQSRRINAQKKLQQLLNITKNF